MRVSHTRFLMLCAASCFVLMSSRFVEMTHAQHGGQNTKLQTLNAEGTIKAANARVLHIAVTGGQEWLVSVPTDYKNIVYEGTATSRWLRRGTQIRFSANLVADRRKMEASVNGPVSELTVAQPNPEVGMGVFPERSNDQRQDLFTRRKKEVKSRRARSGPVEQHCLVVGQVLENKAGRVRVATGNRIVRLELDPKTEVAIQWHGTLLVRPGDKISFVAKYAAGRPGQAQGEQMTITAAKPWDIEEKAAKGAKKGSQKGKSDESGKDAPG